MNQAATQTSETSGLIQLSGATKKFLGELNDGRLNLANLDAEHAGIVQAAAISPLWAPGDLALLVAQKTQGKSVLALDLGLACVVGEFGRRAWGGAVSINPAWFGDGKVVIIDGEDTKARWDSRCKNLLEGRGAATPEAFEAVRSKILYVHPEMLGLRNSKNRAERSRAAARFLVDHGAKMVIGDTVARLWQPEDFRSESWVNEGLGPFHEELKAAGVCSVLLAHHRRPGDDGFKPSGPLGTSQQENQADILLFAERNSDTRVLTIRHEKNRRAWWIDPGAEARLRLTKGRFGYEPACKLGKVWPHDLPEELRSGILQGSDPKEALSDMQREIVDQLESTAPVGMNDDELAKTTGHHKGSINKACHKLKEAGMLKRKTGESGARDVWVLAEDPTRN